MASEPDGAADALLDLDLAILAALAGPMQEQDDGVVLLAGVVVGHEDDVLDFAVLAFVDLVDEAGLFLAGCSAAERSAVLLPM